MPHTTYDLIAVGTGFASSFFLLRYLEKRPNSKVLVLERGFHETHRWRREHHEQLDERGILSSVDYKSTFENLTPQKPWIYTPSFGGGSNCWWACTPRMLPNDLKLKSRYGVGKDWPLSYEDLEPFYCRAEEIMSISGPRAATPYQMSRPYPQPPHRVNSAWQKLTEEQPDQFFPMPTARARQAAAGRGACCATGVCALCPVDAKFTILNSLAELYKRANVELEYGAAVIGLDIQNGSARSVQYRKDGRDNFASGDLVFLGANPIFNAHILLNSGVTHPQLGRRMVDHVGISCYLDLDGLEGLNGSSSATGHGYCWYDGDHRTERAACLIESHNNAPMRIENGKFGHRMMIKFVFEDLPQEQNGVTLGTSESAPAVEFHGHSPYVDRSIDFVRRNIESLTAGLPVESIQFADQLNPTEGHILGTAMMGNDPAKSVVDCNQVVHSVRNVLSGGGSSFPVISPANPSLTIAALSLLSAERLV